MGDPEHEMLEPGLQPFVNRLGAQASDVGRTLDLAWIPANAATPVIEHRDKCAYSSAEPIAFHIWACSATKRSITFSPRPAMRIGIGPAGPGFSFSIRVVIRGNTSLRSRTRSRVSPNS